MGKKLHIICEKCGSDSICIEIKQQDTHDEDCGVYFSCKSCAENTSVEEWNEYNPLNKAK